MRNTSALRTTLSASADHGSSQYSDHMLSELLALNEEMISQLRLERLTVIGTADFLTTMIDQHEKAAALLRTRLENIGTESL